MQKVFIHSFIFHKIKSTRLDVSLLSLSKLDRKIKETQSCHLFYSRDLFSFSFSFLCVYICVKRKGEGGMKLHLSYSCVQKKNNNRLSKYLV